MRTIWALVLAAACARSPQRVSMHLVEFGTELSPTGAPIQRLEASASGGVPALVVQGDGGFKAHVVVPPEAWLRFVPSIPRGLQRGDVHLAVEIRTRGTVPERLWERRITSARTGEVGISLRRFEGLPVELTFLCQSPLPDGDPAGWGVWYEPRITSQAGLKGPSSLVLITVDALRADRIGFMGDSLAITPTMDALASEGFAFTNAFSAFNVTTPSLSTIFTGLYGRDHRVYDLVTPLDSSFVTLAEILQTLGYRTAAFVGVRHLAPEVSGLGQGFQTYQAPLEGEWGAQELTTRAITWLHEHAQHPFFLWLHYFDPHMPYAPPSQWASVFSPGGPRARAGRSLADSLASLTDLTHFGPQGRAWLASITDPAYPEAMYRGEIGFVDQELGRLLEALRSRLLACRTLVVVTADHGESLGEHGIYYDHIGLYREQLHVPLILWGPGLIPHGRSDALVSSVDLLPTLLELVGVGPPLEAAGFSLVPVILRGSPSPRRTVLAQHADNRAATIRSTTWALQRAWLPYSVVRVDTLFFDLTLDPQEHVDLSGTDPRAARMLSELTSWLARGSGPRPGETTIDEPTLRFLRALGYVR